MDKFLSLSHTHTHTVTHLSHCDSGVFVWLAEIVSEKCQSCRQEIRSGRGRISGILAPNGANKIIKSVHRRSLLWLYTSLCKRLENPYSPCMNVAEKKALNWKDKMVMQHSVIAREEQRLSAQHFLHPQCVWCRNGVCGAVEIIATWKVGHFYWHVSVLCEAPAGCY